MRSVQGAVGSGSRKSRLGKPRGAAGRTTAYARIAGIDLLGAVAPLPSSSGDEMDLALTPELLDLEGWAPLECVGDLRITPSLSLGRAHRHSRGQVASLRMTK